MKKKHLHGKLSLKIKDLSAMNGAAKQAIGGGLTQPCTKDWSNCAECEDPTMATCQGGDTCDFTCAASCPGCIPTTPPLCNTDPGATCYTSPEACDTSPSDCNICSGGQQSCPGITTC